MSLKVSILLSILLSTSMLNAQNFNWAGSFGGVGEDVVRDLFIDFEDNAYLTGYFSDSADFDIGADQYQLKSNGFYDVFVQKINKSGDLVWAKGFGGTDTDYAVGNAVDADGNVYITGVFSNSVDFDPGVGSFTLASNGHLDVFILKLNSLGEFVWAKSIGGSGYEESTCIEVDPNGNVVVIGYLYDPVDLDPGAGVASFSSSGSSDAFIVKLDEAGDLVYAKTFGGTDFDLAMDMKINNAGDIFITGYFEGTSDFDPDPSGTTMVSASAFSNSGYILHLDNNANLVSVNNTLGGDVSSLGIALDQSNNIYTTGYFSGSTDFDPDPTNDVIYSSPAAFNGFITKTDPAGNLLWAKHMTCDDSYLSYDIAVGPTNKVYTSGYFFGTADFDPAPSTTFNLSKATTNASEAFLAKMDEDGNFLSAFQFGGVNFVDNHNMGIASDNNVFLSGHFETTVDINPSSSNSLAVSAIDFRDSYLIQMSDPITGIEQQIEHPQIEIYPNPSADHIFIKSSDRITDESYAIFDTMGRLVSNGKLSNNSINITHLAKGAYLLHFAQQQVKLIKK